MVPSPESVYFPPLEKCVNGGDHLLISWKTAFYAILNSDDLEKNEPRVIDNFFSDPAVQALLSQPFAAFPPPSQQSKSAFETKTSPINVTTPSTATYDIKQVKEDALWLSKEAKIDEISALRIVVEECQSRASALLLGPISNEDLAGIQESTGPSQSWAPVALLTQGVDADVIQAEFNKEESRKLRILRTYLSERRYILKCVDYLLQSAIYCSPAVAGSGKGKEADTVLSPMENIGKCIAGRMEESDQWLLRCLAAIEANIKNVDNGSGWFQESGGQIDLELEWTNAQIAEATHTLEIIFQNVDKSGRTPSSTVILAWLNLVSRYNFLQFKTEDAPAATVALVWNMQSILAVISFQMLTIGPCLEHLSVANPATEVTEDDSEPYLLKIETIQKINNVMLSIAEQRMNIAGPTILAWAILLYAIRLRVQDNTSPQELDEEGHTLGAQQDMIIHDVYKGIIDEILADSQDNPIKSLASFAVDDLQALETLSKLALQFGANSHFSNALSTKIRVTILDLVQCCSGSIGYSPEVVTAALSAVTGGDGYWDLLDAKPLPREQDPVAVFFHVEGLISNLLKPARLRYPYESQPFLELSRALATTKSSYGRDGVKTIIDYLERIPSFTYALPDGFQDYETTQEEENNNSIRLTKSVQLFEAKSKVTREDRSSALVSVDQDFCISTGNFGRMVQESRPKVAYWFHEYSGFKYLGKLLETFLAAADQVDATTGVSADRDTVTGIVALLALIINGISRSTEAGKDEALRILELASSGLDRSRDIMTVVFDIFEEELQRQSVNGRADGPLELLTSCTQFIHALMSITPGRVWPLVGRSSLLEMGRGNSKLSTILGTNELVTGRYEFLLSCTRLYEALVEDLAINAASRRCRAKAPARFGTNSDMTGTGVPDQVLAKVLLSFTRFLVDVLETSCTWKFDRLDDCRQLRRNITGTFDKILHYTYGIEDRVPDLADTDSNEAGLRGSISKTFTSKILSAENSKQKTNPKLMAAFEPAALHITDSFLSTSSGSLRVQPILHAYYDGFAARDSTLHLHESRMCMEQVISVLSFSRTLLQVSALLGRALSQLETQHFKATPIIARLYAVNDAYRIPIIALIESLVMSASTNAPEPPSLLGHLGPRTSQNFLHLISSLDKPLSRRNNFSAIMRFLSKVMSCRQQWFANFLLTGRTSRDVTKNKESLALDMSPLNAALDAFANINKMSKIEAVERLEFIAMAQNFWPWATYDSKRHANFVMHISEFVGNLKPLQPSYTTEASIDACYQTKMGALIAEILAMNLFHSRQMGVVIKVDKTLVPNMDYFTRFAVAIPGYNTSLHANLKRNFEGQYSGCKLLDFQRTSLDSRQFGQDYFYDLPLMNKMLSFDPAWIRRTGFGTEVANANVNLSLVDAQISLLNGWKFLALELSTYLPGQEDLQRKLARVATDCLLSNRKSQDSEEVFQRLNQTRADLALILVQRLIEANSSVPEMQVLLSKVWDTIRQSNITFELALNSGDASYYRSMLKLLFLSLGIHSDNSQQTQKGTSGASTVLGQSTSVIASVIEILDRVVGKGLRDLVLFLHDKPAESSPDDLELITSILQACLHIPGIEFCYSQIVTLFVQSDSARVATTLFSWSDTLAINGDPIYGELSILFLLELSTVPAMAEQLAIEGLLSHIGAANITSYLRRGNVSPFADGAGIQRCYSIWVRGILPLLLNLVDAVGRAIATEVALFLIQFPALLKQSITALAPPETSRIKSEMNAKYITLSMCAEAHTLSLLLFALKGFREAGQEIPEVDWDSATMLDNVDEWYRSPQLQERILPMGEPDLAMQKKNKLKDRVQQELEGIKAVLAASNF